MYLNGIGMSEKRVFSDETECLNQSFVQCLKQQEKLFRSIC